jgi:transaldolase
METTHQFHGLGQNLWFHNITRGLLTSGTLRRCIDELSVKGLTTKVGYFKLREEIWQ